MELLSPPATVLVLLLVEVGSQHHLHLNPTLPTFGGLLVPPIRRRSATSSSVAANIWICCRRKHIAGDRWAASMEGGEEERGTTLWFVVSAWFVLILGLGLTKVGREI